METKILKPSRAGLLVRDPVSKRPLKEEGESKQISSYWARRITCGDVVVVEEQAVEEKPAPKKTKREA
jgi:hypothetical protein